MGPLWRVVLIVQIAGATADGMRGDGKQQPSGQTSEIYSTPVSVAGLQKKKTLIKTA